MVSLDSVLRTGVSGLQANQVALNTTSNNIANVNTDGYVRRNVSFESKVLGKSMVLTIELIVFLRKSDVV